MITGYLRIIQKKAWSSTFRSFYPGTRRNPSPPPFLLSLTLFHTSKEAVRGQRIEPKKENPYANDPFVKGSLFINSLPRFIIIIRNTAHKAYKCWLIHVTRPCHLLKNLKHYTIFECLYRPEKKELYHLAEQHSGNSHVRYPTHIWPIELFC